MTHSSVWVHLAKLVLAGILVVALLNAPLLEVSIRKAVFVAQYGIDAQTISPWSWILDVCGPGPQIPCLAYHLPTLVWRLYVWSYAYSFGTMASILYMKGQEWNGFGFWAGRTAIQICSMEFRSMINSDAFNKIPDECNTFLFNKFNSFSINIHIIFTILILRAIKQSWDAFNSTVQLHESLTPLTDAILKFTSVITPDQRARLEELCLSPRGCNNPPA